MSYLMKNIKILLKKIRNLNYYNFRLVKIPNYSEMTLYMSVEQILINEGLYTDKFNRYDIVVRYLVIEHYYGLNDFGLKLYEKMQKKRISQIKKLKNREYDPDRFIYLIENFDSNKLQNISLTKRIKLLDGSHRIALSIYNNIQFLPCIFNKRDYNDHIFYGIDWFYQNDFTDAEISLIKDKLQQIIQEKFTKIFAAIIWSSSYHLAGDIQDDISKDYYVEDSFEIHFESREEYREFIKIVYQDDKISDNRINEKVELNYIPHTRNIVKIVVFKVTEAQYCIDAFDQKDSFTVRKLKTKLRNKYKKRLNNYVYDNILHIFGNEDKSVRFMENIQKREVHSCELSEMHSMYDWTGVM